MVLLEQKSRKRNSLTSVRASFRPSARPAILCQPRLASPGSGLLIARSTTTILASF